MTIPFSILILTLNEEENLHRCLSVLDQCDDVVVLDSFSTDNTSIIAQKHQVRFYQREFDNYARQRNYGLSDISYKHKWLLMVDADEIVPTELIQEIVKVIEDKQASKNLYCMRRKDHFLGKWIKRSSGYPTWFGRLMKIGCVRVEREINEEYVTEGGVGYLENHLLHFPLIRDFQHGWKSIIVIQQWRQNSLLREVLHYLHSRRFSPIIL